MFFDFLGAPKVRHSICHAIFAFRRQRMGLVTLWYVDACGGGGGAASGLGDVQRECLVSCGKVLSSIMNLSDIF